MRYRKYVKALGLPLLLLPMAIGSVIGWGPGLFAQGVAQQGKIADWLTDGGNIERTAWQQNETILSTASVKNMKLLWKTKLDNTPRQMHNLLPVLIIGRVNTGSGPRQMVIATGVTDNIYALDAETGAILWHHHFETSWVPPAGGGRGAGILCPGGHVAERRARLGVDDAENLGEPFVKNVRLDRPTDFVRNGVVMAHVGGQHPSCTAPPGRSSTVWRR